MDLGTLTVELAADNGAFNRSMDKSEKSVEDFTEAGERAERQAEQLGNAMASAQVGIAALAAGVAAAGTALTAMISTQADAVKQTHALAQALGTSTGQLQAFQVAARHVGVEADKADDILKTLYDRIGEAAISGGGQLGTVLDQIGVSIEQLRGKDPVDLMATLAEAISDLPKAQQVHILESIADDASRLLPLLDNGSAALRRITQRAYDTNAALTSIEVQKMLEANQAFERITTSVQGLKNTLAIALAPVVEDIVDDFTRWIQQAHEAGQIKDFFENVGAAAETLLKHLKDIVAQMLAIQGALAGARAGLAFTPGGPIAKLIGAGVGAVAGYAAGYGGARALFNFMTPDELQELKQAKQALSGVNDQIESIRSTMEKIKSNEGLTESFKSRRLKQLKGQLSELTDEAQKYKDTIKDLGSTAAERSKLGNGPTQMESIVVTGETPTGGVPSAGTTGASSITAGMSDFERQQIASIRKSRQAWQAYYSSQMQARQQLVQQYEGVVQRIMTGEQRIRQQYEQRNQVIREAARQGVITWGTAFANIARSHEVMKQRLKQDYDQVSEFARQAAHNIQNALGKTLEMTLSGHFDNILMMWVKTLQQMATQAAAAQLGDLIFGKNFAKGEIGGLAGGLLGWGKSLLGMRSGPDFAPGIGNFNIGRAASGGSWWGSLISGFAGLFADGGTIPAGSWGIAGEDGAEVVHGPATVTPVNQIGGSYNITVPVNIEAGDMNKDEAEGLSRNLERGIRQVVNQELRQAKKPRGMLAT